MDKVFKNEQDLKNYLRDLKTAVNNNEKFYWQEDMITLIDLIDNYLKQKEQDEFSDWLIDREESIGE